jgi:MoxR-like ATPase
MSTSTQNLTESAGLQERIARFQKTQEAIVAQVRKVIVGQEEVIDQVLVALFVGGHCLITGLPGTAKTLLVRTLAQTLGLIFKRIQFTPDLMPSDITGTDIIEEDAATGHRTWTFVQGPIFANILLADEINRTPPKTQAALLEAMQERQVTVGRVRHKLQSPFFVLATQNPIEQEGTYPLPEAQVDRFMLKLKIGYPSREEERAILDLMARTNNIPKASSVIGAKLILEMRQLINDIYIDDKVKDYIVDLVCATRDPAKYKIQLQGLIQLGASPRATISLTLAAKAYAFLKGRGYVTPQDVKSIGMDVLRHRVAITYEAEAEEKTSETIIQKIFDELPVP